MKLLTTLALTLLAVAGIAPAAARAQTTDPDADSPSGVIYEIPLESARDDAAPSGGGGGGTRAGNGDGGTPASAAPAGEAQVTESSIHSENGFGSSSQVPGAAAAESAGTQGSGASAGDGGADANGAGASGGDGSGSEQLIAAGNVGPPPSTDRAYLLIALSVAAAAGLGFAGRQALRKR